MIAIMIAFVLVASALFAQAPEMVSNIIVETGGDAVPFMATWTKVAFWVGTIMTALYALAFLDPSGKLADVLDKINRVLRIIDAKRFKKSK